MRRMRRPEHLGHHTRHSILAAVSRAAAAAAAAGGRKDEGGGRVPPAPCCGQADSSGAAGSLRLEVYCSEETSGVEEEDCLAGGTSTLHSGTAELRFPG